MGWGQLKPVYQTKVGQPEGNCLQACVASILECGLDDVPPFAQVQGPMAWWDEMRRFVRDQTVCDLLATEEFPEDRDVWTAVHPIFRFLLATVDSPNGPWKHSVVVNHYNVVVHDPLGPDSPLVGQYADAHEWTIICTPYDFPSRY